MKYWHMININQAEVVIPTITTSPSPTASVDLNEQLEDIKHMIADILPNTNLVVANKDATNLTDDEVEDILTTLLNYQKTYFSEVPLSKNLDKNFTWNISRDIYEASKRIRDDKTLPDCMDPLYWMYLLFTYRIDYTIGKFMMLAINSISDDEYNYLEHSADKYDEEIGGVKQN